MHRLKAGTMLAALYIGGKSCTHAPQLPKQLHYYVKEQLRKLATAVACLWSSAIRRVAEPFIPFVY